MTTFAECDILLAGLLELGLSIWNYDHNWSLLLTYKILKVTIKWELYGSNVAI